MGKLLDFQNWVYDKGLTALDPEAAQTIREKYGNREAKPTAFDVAALVGENVIFYGATGVGKTTLVNKLIAELEATGETVVFYDGKEPADISAALEMRLQKTIGNGMFSNGYSQPRETIVIDGAFEPLVTPKALGMIARIAMDETLGVNIVLTVQQMRFTQAFAKHFTVVRLEAPKTAGDS